MLGNRGLSLILLFALVSYAFAADNVFTDNIGIGKTSPTAKLDIKGSGTSTGFALRLADSLGLDTLAVLDNGNLGIGTTLPLEKVQIQGGNLLQKETRNPIVVGSLNDDLNLQLASSLAISGKYAYVANYSQDSYIKNFCILDISNPSSPFVVGSLDDDTNLYYPWSLAISGKYCYVANADWNSDIKNFCILDISNPSSPFVVGSLDDDTNLYIAISLAISGKYCYVANEDSNSGKKNFCILDISNPSSPFVVGSLDDDTNLYYARSLAISGKYAYVVNSYTWGPDKKNFCILDISNPSSPFVVGSLDDDTNLYLAHSLAISGKYAYVANDDSSSGTKNFCILDISNPSSPFVVGSLDDDTNLYHAYSLAISGKYAYVANNDISSGKKNFCILDISNPSSPFVVGSLDDDTNLYHAYSLAISGKYCYVANYDWLSNKKNFAILDISGLDAPTASIGNISSNTIRVSENLDVRENLYVGRGLNVGPGGIDSQGPVSITGSGSTSTTSSLIIRNSSGNTLLEVLDNGYVGIGLTNPPAYQLQLSLDSAAKPNGGSWTASSDIRLKTNIKPIDKPLDKILALKGVSFQWKDPAAHGNLTLPRLGLIAQDVEPIFPEWVGTDPQGYKTLTIFGFEALTVEAIRELKRENEEIKALHKELEAIIKRLKSQN